MSIFEPINRFGYPAPEHTFFGYDMSAEIDLVKRVKEVFRQHETPKTNPMLDFDEYDLIKFAEQKVSSWNEGILENFFHILPEPIRDFVVSIVSLFVGEGWHLTLGLLFMVIVIFLPGGLMEGFNRIMGLFKRSGGDNQKSAPSAQPAE